MCRLPPRFDTTRINTTKYTNGERTETDRREERASENIVLAGAGCEAGAPRRRLRLFDQTHFPSSPAYRR